jgi:predicted acetylornithine/succinylornithine family transaminase
LSLPDLSPASVASRDGAFVLGTYARTPFHPRSGEGAVLIDADGKRYWDFLSGIAVNALGHAHPALIAAVRQGAGDLLHVSNLFYHPSQGLLAERLVASSGMSRAFFCNSGTEANEAALKFARLAHPGKSDVVALDGSFHGRTFGSLSVTGNEAYRTPFAPLLGGEVTFVAPNDIAALEAAVVEGTAVIILEPILGEGGVVPLTNEFLGAARSLADRFGATLVFDEIQCGLGRTGSLFAFQQTGVRPDIVTLAKPLGGGLPLGAVLLDEVIVEKVRPGHHGTTFGGNPLACRLGLAVLDEIENAGLLDVVAERGALLTELLSGLGAAHGVVEVRGRGLMVGIELDRPAGPVSKAMLENGFVVGTARERVVRLLPPYVIPEQAIRELVATLDIVLKENLQ